MPARHELRPKFDVVLDDAVVDDGDTPGAIEMRMRVGGLDATVGRPTRVTDALGRARIGADTAVDATDIFVDEEVIRGGEGQPPRVVASVLERFQRGEDRVAEIGLLADVAEYAAHAFPSLAGTPA